MPPLGTSKEEVSVTHRVDFKWGCNMRTAMFCEASLAVVGAGADLSWTGPEEGPLPKFRTLRICPRDGKSEMGRRRVHGVQKQCLTRAAVSRGRYSDTKRGFGDGPAQQGRDVPLRHYARNFAPSFPFSTLFKLPLPLDKTL